MCFGGAGERVDDGVAYLRDGGEEVWCNVKITQINGQLLEQGCHRETLGLTSKDHFLKGQQTTIYFPSNQNKVAVDLLH